MNPRLLNLGCGSKYCSDSRWTNIDFVARGSGVIQHDLLQGIPFDAAQFDAVYHSNVLEHFTAAQGVFLMQECFRVLKPGGFVRVVVPDLENICRAYMSALGRLNAGDESCRQPYEWLKMELYDQVTRSHAGGEMSGFLKDCSRKDLEYVIERVGADARALAENENSCDPSPESGLMFSLWWWKLQVGKIPRVVRECWLNAVLQADEKKALKMGQFRMSGEIHQCMYDGYSLKKLMVKSGFHNCHRVGPSESSIPGWSSYYLDIDVCERINAPVALFMEGGKTG